MSFARQRLALGVASRLRALPRSNSTHLSLTAYRLLSTTSRRSHAEPINVKHEEPYHGHRLEPVALRSPSGTATLNAENEPGEDVNPYKGGQSAIDEAVHMFFFTEILRGANVMVADAFDRADGVCSHVDCAGEFLPRALHDHVPV
jgi:NADH dehydrogenase (ubiquinone) Fe-S protein 8